MTYFILSVLSATSLIALVGLCALLAFKHSVLLYLTLPMEEGRIRLRPSLALLYGNFPVWLLPVVVMAFIGLVVTLNAGIEALMFWVPIPDFGGGGLWVALLWALGIFSGVVAYLKKTRQLNYLSIRDQYLSEIVKALNVSDFGRRLQEIKAKILDAINDVEQNTKINGRSIEKRDTLDAYKDLILQIEQIEKSKHTKK